MAVVAVVGITSRPASSADATDEGKTTATVAFLDAAADLNPQTAGWYPDSVITSNLADRLVYAHAEGDGEPETFEPWLAESWEVSDDATTFTFHLRDDVTFSDGTAFTAESVKENFDSKGFGQEELGVVANSTYFHDYVGTEAVDEHTAVVTFSKPYAGFIAALSHYSNAILGSSTLELPVEDRGLPGNLVATGPFVLTSHTYQESTVLTRRDDYDWAPASLEHDGAAYLEEITFITLPEASVRTGSLRSGEVDAILDVLSTDEASLEEDGYNLFSQPVAGVNISLFAQADVAPTNDIAVRKALQLAWDRDSLEETVLTDRYRVADSVIPAEIEGYESFDDVLRYDPEEAKSILDEAGWEVGSDGIREKDGQRLTIQSIAIDNLVINKPALELIQQQAKDVGIEIDLNVLPRADYSTQITATGTWNTKTSNTTYVDPAVLLNSYDPEGANGLGLVEGTQEYTELHDALVKLNSTLDPELRQQYTEEAQRLLIEEYALITPIYVTSQVIASQPDFTGFAFDGNGRALLVDASFAG